MPLVKTSYYSSLIQKALPEIKHGVVAFTQLDSEAAAKVETPIGSVLELKVETYKIEQEAILVRLLFPEILPTKEIKFNTVYLLDADGKVLFVDLLKTTYFITQKEEEPLYLPTFSYLFKLTEIDAASVIAKSGIFMTYSDLARHNNNSAAHPYILSRLPYYGETSVTEEPIEKGKLWIDTNGVPYYFNGTEWAPLKAKKLADIEDVSKILLANRDTTITAKWTFSVPFELSSAIHGQLVPGLNSDMVDGFEPSILPDKGKIVSTPSDSSTIAEGWLPSTLEQDYTFNGQLVIGKPFVLADSVKGQLIEGLNADQVDGLEPSATPDKGKIVSTPSDSSTIAEGWLPSTLEQDYTFNGQLVIGKPFVLADSVKGQLIEGLNADQVDGLEPSATPDKGKIVSTPSDSSTIAEGWLPSTLEQDYTFKGRVTFSTPLKWAVKTITADYTVTEQDKVLLIDASDNDITITLPALEEGTVIVVKRKDDSTNTVTLKGTVEGQEDNSITLNSKNSVILIFASGWWKIS